MSILFLLPAALLVLVAVTAIRQLAWAGRLPRFAGEDRPADRDADTPVSCSVVVPVRNEAARLPTTLAHLLGQQDVELEVVVVDDRSTDETPAIIAAAAAGDSRVRTIRIDALPEGWLGKCHACHRGAEAASGEWLLFTDADCWLAPDVIARALRVAQSSDAAHVTMTPGVVPESLPATAYHLALLTRLSGWLAAVNRDRPNAYVGFGAFNLVRADVYRACGGYRALRLTVVDDMRLGLLVSRTGQRTRAFIGGSDAECHWGTTVRSMVRLMEKNYFAAADYRVAPVVVGTIVGGLLWGAVLLGPWTGTIAGWLAFAALWTLAVPAVVLARRLGWPVGGALLAPCLYAVLQYAVARSMWITLARGGVRWRDAFYPLDVLRRGTVRQGQ